MIELQRTVGNRVVGQVLVVQRQKTTPKGEYGLDTPVSQDRYVDDAVKLWKNQPGMSLVAFAEAMLRTIGVELKGYGVPFFGWTFVSGAGALGSFDSKAWKVNVNVAKFSKNPKAKTLKDITLDEVTEVIGTLYHESRHTDQDVLIIRVLLDQKKTVDQIFAATKMRKDVIDAVKATTYKDPLDPDEIAHAGRMFDVMYGAHKEFLEFLMKHQVAVEALATLAAPTSKISAATKHIKVFSTWQSGVLQPKVKQMAAAKNLSAVESALMQRLQQIDTELTALLQAWKKVAGAKQPAAADLDAVREHAGDAHGEVIATYTSLEGESDAFRVEGEIKTAFGQKVAKP